MTQGVCVCVRGNCLMPMVIDRLENEHVRRLLTDDKRRDWHVLLPVSRYQTKIDTIGIGQLCFPRLLESV